MIKIDYEGAWKELKSVYGEDLDLNIIGADAALKCYMDSLERKHTHNYIDIRKRSNKEIADYCLKKYNEMYLELVCLKQKLKKLSKRGGTMPMKQTYLK